MGPSKMAVLGDYIPSTAKIGTAQMLQRSNQSTSQSSLFGDDSLKINRPKILGDNLIRVTALRRNGGKIIKVMEGCQ